MSDGALTTQLKLLPRRALVEALLVELSFELVNADAGELRFSGQPHQFEPADVRLA